MRLSLLALWSVCTLTCQAQSFQVAPYLQFGTDSSMVVLWETPMAGTSEIRYGESRLGDETPNLSQRVALDGERTMHEIVLTGLKPATKYFWQAISTFSDGSRLASEAYTFRTTVDDSAAFAFVLYGDTQNNPEVWGKLAELGWLERPNFGILAGDLVDRGGHLPDWLVDFFPPGHVFMSRYPLYTVLGNHEDDHAYYYQYMHNPPPEYYYTFTYGNAQFFMIDTNRDVTEGSEQYNWLEWQLARSTATWKFVVHHHPPYSSEENDHGNSWTGSTRYGTHARNLVPLYEHYGVDFCLFGHVHMYERTWPIFEGSIDQQNGVIYINSGGGGGGLEQFAPTRSWFSAKVKSTHHYGYFAIQDRTLMFQAIDQEGRLFDQFELKKDANDQQARIALPPAPHIEPFGGFFMGSQSVTLSAALDDLTIHYTTDGSTPTSASPIYTEALTFSETTALQTVAIAPNGATSRVQAVHFRAGVPKDPVRVRRTQPGLAYRYYEGQWDYLPNFTQLDVLQSGTTLAFDLDAIKQVDDAYGIVFTGYIDVPTDGVYTFYTSSDDGTKLYIGGEEIVDNDGSHSVRERSGQVVLKQGKHAFEVRYFEDHGGEALSVLWEGPDFPKQHVRAEVLSH